MLEKHPILAQRPNSISDEAWNNLLPDGRGLVYVPEWQKYHLPIGQNTSYGIIYSVALFHQVHCLGQVRRFSYMFLDAIVKNHTGMQGQIKKMFGEMDHGEHLLHCFDYSRQTLQCAGDMRWSGRVRSRMGRRISVDGWGIPHECKDWVGCCALLFRCFFPLLSLPVRSWFLFIFIFLFWFLKFVRW